jgi:hypothetical protein
MNPRPTANRVTDRVATQTTALRGHGLLAARAAWLVLAALTLGLFFASVPAAYARWDALCQGSGCDVLQLSREGVEALERSGLSVGFYVAYNVALRIVLALGYWVIGAILFWKRSDERLSLYASVALLTFGTIQADTLYLVADARPAWGLPIDFVYFVGEASFFVLFCVFPDGRFVPRWTRWAAAVWVAYWLLDSFFPYLPFVGPGNWAPLIHVFLISGLLGSLAVAQVHRYRRVSTQEQRQQTKWVVFGFAAAIATIIAVLLISWVFPLTEIGIPQGIFDLVVNTVITLAALLIPLSIGFAILRHRLWDIDLIINRTLVYGTLSAALATVFAVTNTLVLPFLVQAALGKANVSLNVGVSAVIIAVLFEPLRRRIQDAVDRLSDRLAGGGTTGETLEREEDVFIPPPSH